MKDETGKLECTCDHCWAEACKLHGFYFCEEAECFCLVCRIARDKRKRIEL